MLEGFLNSCFRSGLSFVHCLRVFACHSASWRFSLARYFALNVEGLAFRCLLTSSRTFFRSEEHTSELQSQSNLVCRLLLEKKKKKKYIFKSHKKIKEKTVYTITADALQ